jgi:glycerol kinase
LGAIAAACTTTHASLIKVTCGTGTFISQSTNTFRLYPGFYTTIAPHPARAAVYVLESKIQRGGKQVEPLLKDSSKLTIFFENLAEDIENHFKRLPTRPREIVLDGGVTRDGILQSWIEKKSHVKIVTLPLFDGTGLGTAFLCRDVYLKKIALSAC